MSGRQSDHQKEFQTKLEGAETWLTYGNLIYSASRAYLSSVTLCTVFFPIDGTQEHCTES